MGDHLDGYESTTFSANGTTKTVFRNGSGPAVIVISEMPGITPLVAAFGQRVADIGCTAVLPKLFGDPGRSPSMPYLMQSLAQVCISREFSMLALRRTSPVTTWLRARWPDPNTIGAVGPGWVSSVCASLEDSRSP